MAPARRFIVIAKGRECLDHVIILGERQWRHVLNSVATYTTSGLPSFPGLSTTLPSASRFFSMSPLRSRPRIACLICRGVNGLRSSMFSPHHAAARFAIPESIVPKVRSDTCMASFGRRRDDLRIS